MLYPCLVSKRFCTKKAKVVIDSTELNEDGELVPAFEYTGKCNLQMGARVSFSKNKEEIKISGIALFPGDFCPDIQVIASGTVEIDGFDYEINMGRKNHNPDGTVNYITLELL